MNNGLDQLCLLFALGLIAFVVYYKAPFRPSKSAHGTARWADGLDCRQAGLLADRGGLLLGRSLGGGRLIWMNGAVHTAVFSPAGGGKSSGLAIPWLLTYRRGSVIILDVKGELYRTTGAARQALGQRVVRLDPFEVCGPGGDAFNPLDLIGSDPGSVDDARAFAEAMVIRPSEGDKDPHWNDQASNVLTCVLSFILAHVQGGARTLSFLREIVTDPGRPPDDQGQGGELSGIETVAGLLRDRGGIYANLGGLLLSLQDRERAGVLSTVNRHTTFLDSPAIGPATSSSSFAPRDLLEGNTTVYLVLPAHQLEAQARWLRLVIASFIRLLGREGMQGGKELLLLLDEAGQLGHMEAIEQGLTLLRSQGLRMAFFFQSLGQLKKVFKDKSEVLLDNCETIWFGTQSYETAERVSKMLGDSTICVESASTNQGRSYQEGGAGQNGGPQCSHSAGRNWSVQKRELMRPEEVLTMPQDRLIAFLRGVPPILCRRLAWYSDPLFGTARRCARRLLWWCLAAAAAALVAWRVAGR